MDYETKVAHSALKASEHLGLTIWASENDPDLNWAAPKFLGTDEDVRANKEKALNQKRIFKTLSYLMIPVIPTVVFWFLNAVLQIESKSILAVCFLLFSLGAYGPIILKLESASNFLKLARTLKEANLCARTLEIRNKSEMSRQYLDMVSEQRTLCVFDYYVADGLSEYEQELKRIEAVKQKETLACKTLHGIAA